MRPPENIFYINHVAQLRYTEMHPGRATLRALHGVGDRRVCVPPEEGTEGGEFVTNGRSVFILSVSVQEDTVSVSCDPGADL